MISVGFKYDDDVDLGLGEVTKAKVMLQVAISVALELIKKTTTFKQKDTTLKLIVRFCVYNAINHDHSGKIMQLIAIKIFYSCQAVLTTHCRNSW